MRNSPHSSTATPTAGNGEPQVDLASGNGERRELRDERACGDRVRERQQRGAHGVHGPPQRVATLDGPREQGARERASPRARARAARPTARARPRRSTCEDDEAAAPAYLPGETPAEPVRGDSRDHGGRDRREHEPRSPRRSTSKTGWSRARYPALRRVVRAARARRRRRTSPVLPRLRPPHRCRASGDRARRLRARARGQGRGTAAHGRARRGTCRPDGDRPPAGDGVWAGALTRPRVAATSAG